jgi:eukaryotic-like serine/threonine-protein kinase
MVDTYHQAGRQPTRPWVRGGDFAMTGGLTGYTELRELGYPLPGRTVLAVNDATGERVMVRYFPADLPASAARRMRLLSTVDSPYLVRIRELVWQETVHAAVLDPVRAVCLRDLLADQGVATPEGALHVLRGSLCGLAAAHAAGVVHGGYGPDVVLIDAEGEIKLIDFGVVPAGLPPGVVPAERHATGTDDVRAAVAVFVGCLAADLVYPTEKVLLAAAPPALRGLVRAGLSPDVDAVALLASLDDVAVAEFGPDWPTRGRLWLALRAAESRIESLRAEAALAEPPLDEPDGMDGPDEGAAIAAALAAEELLLQRLRAEDGRIRAGRLGQPATVGPAVPTAGDAVPTEETAAVMEAGAPTAAAGSAGAPAVAAEETAAGAAATVVGAAASGVTGAAGAGAASGGVTRAASDGASGAVAGGVTGAASDSVTGAVAGGVTGAATGVVTSDGVTGAVEQAAGGSGSTATGEAAAAPAPGMGGANRSESWTSGGPRAGGAAIRPGGATSPAGGRPAPGPARHRRRPRRILIGALVALLVVGVGLATFWLTGRQERAGAGPAVPAAGPASPTPTTTSAPAPGPAGSTAPAAEFAVSPSPTWSPAPAYSYIPGQGLG